MGDQELPPSMLYDRPTASTSDGAVTSTTIESTAA